MLKMARPLLCALAIASVTGFPAAAQAQGHPPALALEGGAQLSRAGQATRTHLLGAVELYSVAVYADGPVLDRAQLQSPDVPKAVRIEIGYQDNLRRQIWIDWHRELVPELSPAATSHLRGAFASLRRGDVVLVEYVPGRGTTIRVDKSVVASDASHDLMLAFLEHWLGQRPVSEELKQALIGTS
jgi:hypothetical protein